MHERASWRASELGPARTLDGGGASARTSRARGPPIAFVHGALVNANLWRKVAPPRRDTRVTLDLPSAPTSSRCRATPT